MRKRENGIELYRSNVSVSHWNWYKFQADCDKESCYFSNKHPSSQACGFSSSHVWMLELDYKEI